MNMPRKTGLVSGAGSMSKCPRTISSAAQDSARHGRKCDHAARSRKRGFKRNNDQPDRGKGFDAAGVHRHRHDETRQRQRRQHMGAFVAAGARQEPRQQDRGDQPGERRDLKRARRAAHREIDRECRESHQASEQPRRHEGAMARARQHVIARRRMQQRIKAIADDIQNSHGTRASACSSNRRAGTPPLSLRHRVRATLSER